MGFRFRKSFKIAPGVKLNLGKKSAGLSVGGKYGGVSFNTRTGARGRVSIPKTGLSYSTKLTPSKKRGKSRKGESFNTLPNTGAASYTSREPKRISTDIKDIKRGAVNLFLIALFLGFLLLLALPSIFTIIIFGAIIVIGVSRIVSLNKNPDKAVQAAIEYNDKLESEKM